MTNLPFTGEFKVTQIYGVKSANYIAGYHTGIDLVGITSKDVYATCDGTIYKTGYSPSDYGNYIVVKDSNTGNYHWFCHLEKINKKTGNVTRLTKIGVMGNTGNSTGAHTHYEIRKSSNKYRENINPATYMGIPNSVGTYNSKNYSIDNVKNPTTRVFKVRTNIREKPTINSTPYLYKENTTVEILECCVTAADGYTWDKVYCKSTNRTGYVAHTANRYK